MWMKLREFLWSKQSDKFQTVFCRLRVPTEKKTNQDYIWT